MADRIAELIGVLKVGDDDAKARAATALLADNVMWRRREIVASGALPPLVVMLETGSESAKGCAAHALGYLALSYHTKAPIVAAGVVPPLIALVKTGSESAKYHAAFALGVLAADNEDNAVVIAEAGAIPPLVELARAGKDWAFSSLKNLADNDARKVSWTMLYALLASPAEPTCVACLDRPRSVVVVPCGHLCLCPECAARLPTQHCPICRAAATTMITVRRP